MLINICILKVCALHTFRMQLTGSVFFWQARTFGEDVADYSSPFISTSNYLK